MTDFWDMLRRASDNVTYLRDALLRIVGDKPAPHEDPYERCRQIAADALGYPAPAPMQSTDLMDALRQATINLRAFGNQDSLGQAVARAWNPYSRMTEPTRERDVIELVSHGELMALKERDQAIKERDHWKTVARDLADGPSTQHPSEFVARVLMDRQGRHDPMELVQLTEVIRCARLDGRKHARDEIVALKAELTTLRSHVAERDASVVNAIRTGKAFRHG